jgi:hypothetical protein
VLTCVGGEAYVIRLFVGIHVGKCVGKEKLHSCLVSMITFKIKALLYLNVDFRSKVNRLPKKALLFMV